MSDASPKTHAQPERAHGEHKREPASPSVEHSAESAMETPSLAGLLADPLADPSIDRHVALLTDPRFSASSSRPLRNQLVSDLQRTYGNLHVQRVMSKVSKVESDTASNGGVARQTEGSNEQPSSSDNAIVETDKLNSTPVSDGISVQRSLMGRPRRADGLIEITVSLPASWAEFERDIREGVGSILHTAVAGQLMSNEQFTQQLMDYYGSIEQRSRELRSLTLGIRVQRGEGTATGTIVRATDAHGEYGEYGRRAAPAGGTPRGAGGESTRAPETVPAVAGTGGAEGLTERPTAERGGVPSATGGAGAASRVPEGVAQYVRGLETIGDIASARWLWNPITQRMARWEAELDQIGENLGREPVLGQVLLPVIAVLFVILQSIVGTLDFLAQLNPLNLAARIGSMGTRLTTGMTSPEEMTQEITEIGDQGLDILTLGLRQAAAHFREGIEEMNLFRISQAIAEILAAVLALVGVFRGIRAARARVGSRGAGAATAEAGRPTETGRTLRPSELPEAYRPTEPGAPGRPTETGRTLRPSELPEAYRPTEPAAGRPTETGRTLRPSEVGEAYRPTEPGAEFRPTEPGGAGRPTETGRTLRPSEVGEAYRPTEPAPRETAAAGRTTGTGRPPSAGPAPPRSFEGISVEYIIREVADVRILRDQVMRGERPGRCQQGSTSTVQGEWEAFGGRGTAPPAWWQSDGVLRINVDRAGWPSAEVQAAHSARVAATSQPRAAAPLRLMVRDVIPDVEMARHLMQDPAQIRAGIDRRPNGARMQRAWEMLGEDGPAPAAFIDSEGVLVVNMEAVGSVPSPR